MESTVAKVKKNANAEVWVSLRDYQGRQFVDVREFFLLAEDRQWHPTRKGVMIQPELLAQVIDGIEALDALADVGTVAEIRKSASEEIQVGLREFEGKRYGEIRKWYWAEGGEKKPAKGVTFKPDMVDRLVKALHAAEGELNQ